MIIPTPNRLSRQARRLDALNEKVQDVINALKIGAVLQFDQGAGRPKWHLLPSAREVDPKVAALVTRDYRVVVGDDGLFPETPAQTFRSRWRNGHGR